MKTVKVYKNVLLEKVIENRNEHKAEYAEMIAEYKIQLIEALKTLLEKTKKSDVNFSRSVSLSEPQNNIQDYDRVISMLEMSVDDEIELDSHEYEQYVMNNWHWSSSFNVSKRSYMTQEI